MGQDEQGYIGIPRGLCDELMLRCHEADIKCHVEDERTVGKNVLSDSADGTLDFLYPHKSDSII